MRFRAHVVAAILALCVTLGAATRIAMPPLLSAHDSAEIVPHARASLLDGPSTSLTADVELDIHESLFNKITTKLLPIIIQQVRNMVIPGESQKHFRFSDIHISEFNIASLDIGFAPPNQVVVKLRGLSLAIPDTDFAVMDKILFVHITCKGHFSAAMSNTNVDVDISLIRAADGSFGVGSVTPTINFGSLQVHEKLDNFFCKIGQDIIQLFIGHVTTLIQNLIKKDAPALIGKAIDGALVKALSKLKVNLVSQPVATDNSISVTIDVLPTTSSSKHRSNIVRHVSHKKAAPSVGAFAARDIEVFTGSHALDNLIEYEREKGRLEYHKALKGVNTSVFEALLPAAYHACPSCPMALDVFFPISAPVALVGDDSIGLAIDTGVLGLTAVNSTGGVISLIELSINASGSAYNVSTRGAAGNVIYFQLALSNFTLGLWKSSVGPFNPSSLGNLISFVLQSIVLPDFNKKFAGIPIPSFGSLTVTELEVGLANGKIDLGIDLNL